MMNGYWFEGMHGWAPGIGGLGSGLWVSAAMGLGFLLLVGLIVWFVVSQQRQTNAGFGVHTTPPASPTSPTPTAEDSALRIARERFARGEIGLEEYERLVAALRG